MAPDRKEGSSLSEDDQDLRFRNFRRSRGFKSPEELGDRVGLHFSTIAAYERGERRPNDETAEKLAEALGTTKARILELLPSQDTEARPETRRITLPRGDWERVDAAASANDRSPDEVIAEAVGDLAHTA